MVKNRTEQARQLGYENYVELGYYRMNRNCYDKEMVENFRKQVKEYFVPFAIDGQVSGHTDSIKQCDLVRSML